MKIDAHQHFWRFDAERDTWITPDMSVLQRDFLPADLKPLLKPNGVRGCIAVESSPSVEHTKFLLELAREHSFIKGVVGWVDLLGFDRDRVLAELARDNHLVGIRYGAQDEPDDFLTRPAVIAGIDALKRVGLKFDILIREHQLPAAIALATQLPNQQFVLDHIGKPRIRERVREPWRALIHELARRPNVHCKMSGMATEADWTAWQPADLTRYLDEVLDAFGTDRVMFGSDWPVCLLAADYDRVVRVMEDYAAVLTQGERAALFGDNAARFYGLTP